MSHELRTPLNAVIGFSEMLSLETFGSLGSARNKEYVKDIHASGVHLLALINDILDIARIDAGEAKLNEEIVDLQGVAAQALRMVTPQARSRTSIRLAEEIDPEVRIGARRRAPAEADAGQSGWAMRSSSPIRAARSPSRARRGPDGLAIDVSDTGIGIAEKDIPVALSYFGQIDSTLARKYEGTGLGLPLAKQLAELHGGTLTIESTRMSAPRSSSPCRRRGSWDRMRPQ